MIDKTKIERKRILKLAIGKYIEWLDTHKELATEETRFFISQSLLVRGYNKKVVDNIYKHYSKLKKLWVAEGKKQIAQEIKNKLEKELTKEGMLFKWNGSVWYNFWQEYLGENKWKKKNIR